MLDELATAAAQAVATVGSAVVTVGRGSGVVVAPGHVLTNAHNLMADPLHVRFGDGTTVDAAVTAVDPDSDLAVVAADTGDRTPPAWADAPPTTGAAVLALGPTRSGGPRVTFGLVSADDQAFRGPRGRRIHGAVEHTAPLGRGSSGGPIVDLRGRLLGINTHRRGDGFYLAQPVTTALRERVDALVRGQGPRTVRLGVAVAPPHVTRRLREAVGLEPRDGVLVRDVDPDGVAARAGMRRGDLVVAADGDPVATPDDLLDRLGGAEDGLLLTVVRGGDEVEVRVQFDSDGPREEGSA